VAAAAAAPPPAHFDVRGYELSAREVAELGVDVLACVGDVIAQEAVVERRLDDVGGFVVQSHEVLREHPVVGYVGRVQD